MRLEQQARKYVGNKLDSLIKKYPDKKWDWRGLLVNPNMTWRIEIENDNITSWEIVEANPYVNWNWSWISKNKITTWEIVEANPKKQWNWFCLSMNPNITFDIVEANPKKPWKWEYLSDNPNITWEIVEMNPEKPWDWKWLSCNPNITWDIIEANPDKQWDWCGLSYNPNITFEIIEKNIDKIDFEELSWNKFTLEYETKLKQLQQRNILIKSRKQLRNKMGKQDSKY